MKKAIDQLDKTEEKLEEILDWVNRTDIKVDTNSGKMYWENMRNRE